MTFGEWALFVRRRMGLTQNEVSHLLGIHWTTLSRWERGLAQPSLEQIVKLARRYLSYALHPTEWLPSVPLGSSDLAGKLAHFSDCGSPVLGEIVQDRLERGHKLLVLCDPKMAVCDALAEFTAGTTDGAAALRAGQVEGIPLDRLFGEAPFETRAGAVLERALSLDTAKHRGSHVAAHWLVDFRPVLASAKIFPHFLVVDRIVDSLFADRTHELSMCIYPPSVQEDRHGAILLSRQPQLIVGDQAVQNPFYGDRHLVFVVHLLEAIDGDDPSKATAPPPRGNMY